MRQRRPNLTQMAATLALYVPWLIPEHLRDKSAKVILAALDFHHDPIPYADGGTCDPQNLTPLLREEHKRITRKVTIPTIAKNKRIRRKEALHQEAMAKKTCSQIKNPLVGTWTKRDDRSGRFSDIAPRKMKSQGFRGHRKFDGTAVWKKKALKD